MLPQSNLVTFIATNDLEQAKYFYQTVLGLNLVSEDAWVLGFLVSGARLRALGRRRHGDNLGGHGHL